MTPVESFLDWLRDNPPPNWEWWIDGLIILFLLALIPLSRLLSRYTRLTTSSWIPEDDMVGGVPDDRTIDDNVRGRLIADRMMLTSYIHRRVERMSFHEHRRVSRHVSVDLGLSEGQDVVPVGLQRKDPSSGSQVGLRTFSVMAEPWGSLPLLGRRDNSICTFDALTVWFEIRIRQVLGNLTGSNQPVTLTSEEKRRLWEIVSGTEEEATGVVRSILAREPEARRLLERGPANDLPRELNSLGPLGRLALALPFDQALGIAISRLAISWVVLVKVPEPARSDRMIIKYEHDDHVEFDGSLVPWRRAFWSGLGWIPAIVQVPSVTSLPSKSVHIEFRAPAGLEIESAVLVSSRIAVVRSLGRQKDDPDLGLESKQVRRLFASLSRESEIPGSMPWVSSAASDSEVSRHGDVSHVYLPNATATRRLGALVAMRLERTGQLQSGVLGAFLLAALLWLGAARPSSFVGGPDTVLLAAPTALVGVLLFRQHRFVSQVSRSLRFLLWTTVGISAIAIGLSVAVGSESPEVLRNGFRWLRWPATVITSLLIPSLIGRRLKNQEPRADKT